MKRIILFISISLLVFFFLGFTHKSNFGAKNSTIIFCPDSYLKIRGNSNINTFECELDMGILSDSMNIFYIESKGLLKFNNTRLVIPNRNFNCGGKIINKDFHELLDTQHFPEISIQLKDAVKLTAPNNCTEATVEVIICGIKKTYNFPVNIDLEQITIIEGVIPLNINDFKLESPKKMFGIIKVSPIIEIEYLFNVILLP